MTAVFSNFELEAEEKKALREAQYFESLSHSPAWPKLKEYMQALVDEASEAMAGNISNEPMTYMRFQIRWQQRQAMMRAVIQYVDTMVETKKELVQRATEEQNEYDPNYH